MKNHRKRGLNLRNWLITASAGLIGYLPLSQRVEAISRKPTLDGNTLVYESEEEWRNESPDFTLDKRVNFADFLEFVNAYGSNNERYDLNGNGKVDFEDFLEFVECFGRDIRIEEPQIPPLQKIADQSVEQVDAVVNPKKVNLGEAVPQELKQRGVDYALSGNVRGLKVSLEDSILTYRPFGTFNSEDNGDAYVEFTVTPKNSDKSQKGEVKVAVRKNDRAMQHYQETIPVTGVERWPDANNDGLVEDADTIFIYAGNALNPGDPDDIRLATGPKPTKEQVGYAIEDFKRRSDITSGAFFENPWTYGASYFVLVCLFTYFYTAVTFDPKGISSNLQKMGGFIPGIRPGQPTASFLYYILNRILLIGALFLGGIAVMPSIIQGVTGITAFQFLVGGTSLMIVVSVVLETMRQIRSQLQMREYDTF